MQGHEERLLSAFAQLQSRKIGVIEEGHEILPWDVCTAINSLHDYEAPPHGSFADATAKPASHIELKVLTAHHSHSSVE